MKLSGLSLLFFSKFRFSKPKYLIFLLVASFAAIAIFAVAIIYKFRSQPTYKPLSDTTQVNFREVLDRVKTRNVVSKPFPTSAILPGAKWVPQSFNNCGPATVSMILQYFGHNVNQNVTKSHLRTNPDDKNVFSYEISDYLKNQYGIESKLLYNGDIIIIKRLIANGFYVMVEDWLHPNEDIGHVTIIRGYDDNQGVLIADDSFIGVNIMYKYEEFERTQWKAFNREYMPIYRAEQEGLLKDIIGENWNERVMFENAIVKANSEIAQKDLDMYAYFNLGTSYYNLNQYDLARQSFEKARSIGWPKRMLWYQIQPIQTYNELGEYSLALELASLALAGNDSFAEVHFEKARSYKGLGEIQKARYEAERALFYSKDFVLAKELLSSL